MCKSLVFSLHFCCSYNNATTGSVVDIPGLKPKWLSLVLTISLSRDSMIGSHSFMKFRQLDSPVSVAIEDVTFVLEYRYEFTFLPAIWDTVCHYSLPYIC